MNVKVYSVDGKETGEMEARVFDAEVREDLIRRAFLAIMSHERQPYGTDPLAGQRSSAHYHGRRHTRWTMMNREMARLPRIHGKVGHLLWRVRVVPHAVKGRSVWAPTSQRVFREEINKKERRKAIASALSASMNPEYNRKRGHLATSVVVDDAFESISKTRDVVKALMSLGFSDELRRAEKKKIRAGKGKNRGRPYRKKKGPLIIVSSESSPVFRASKNISGVDVVEARRVNVKLLAPGGHPGRVMIATKSAVEKMDELWGVYA